MSFLKKRSRPSTELLPDAGESGKFGAAKKSITASTAQCEKRKRVLITNTMLKFVLK